MWFTTHPKRLSKVHSSRIKEKKKEKERRLLLAAALLGHRDDLFYLLFPSMLFSLSGEILSSLSFFPVKKSSDMYPKIEKATHNFDGMKKFSGRKKKHVSFNKY
jgi:hypothetical protein